VHEGWDGAGGEERESVAAEDEALVRLEMNPGQDTTAVARSLADETDGIAGG
jgi:hypothetical protein